MNASGRSGNLRHSEAKPRNPGPNIRTGSFFPHLRCYIQDDELAQILFAAFHALVDERVDGHGAHAARNRGVGRCHVVEALLDIADATRVVTGVHDDRALLDPFLLDEFRLADRTHEDVGLLHEFGEVFGLAVANGHGAVRVQKHQGHGLAEDGATAHDHGVLARERDVVCLQEAHDAGRRCATVSGFAHRHAAKSEAGHAVNVLAGVDGFEGGAFIDVARDRVLQQNAVHVVVVVEFLDLVQEFFGGGVFGEHHADAFHPHAPTGVALHLHVGGARRVVAHQDGCEDRGLARLFLEFCHAGAEFFFSGLGECLAVEDECCHNVSGARVALFYADKDRKWKGPAEGGAALKSVLAGVTSPRRGRRG